MNWTTAEKQVNYSQLAKGGKVPRSRLLVTIRGLVIGLIISATFFGIEPAAAEVIIQGPDIHIQPVSKAGVSDAEVTISFTTSTLTQAHVVLSDQNVAQRLEKEDRTYALNHEFTYTKLPDTSYQLIVEVTAQDNDQSAISDRFINTKNGTVSIGASSPGAQETSSSGGPCGSVNSDGRAQPSCVSSGTEGAPIGQSFLLAGEPPAAFQGPFSKICRKEALFVWIPPAPVAGDFTVVDGENNQIAPPLGGPDEQPVFVYGLISDKSELSVGQFFARGYDDLKSDQTYTAQLSLRSQPFAVETSQLSVNFTHSNTDDEQPCTMQQLIDFLAEHGVKTGSAGAGIGSAGAYTEPGTGNDSPTASKNTSTLVALLASTIIGSSSLADLLWWLFLVLVACGTLLGIYFFAKRRRLWGVVYDARTKQPVEMAVIRLFDQQHHKLLETRVTPASGRYSFLAEPGEFYLEVTKEGYHFPSRIVTSHIDNEYINLYRGEVIKLGAGQSLVAPDIPVDSEAGEVKQAGFFRRIVFPILDTVRLPILILGAVIAPAVYLASQEKELETSFILPIGIFLIVLFLISEFLFVRRGRK